MIGGLLMAIALAAMMVFLIAPLRQAGTRGHPIAVQSGSSGICVDFAVDINGLYLIPIIFVEQLACYV